MTTPLESGRESRHAARPGEAQTAAPHAGLLHAVQGGQRLQALQDALAAQYAVLSEPEPPAVPKPAEPKPAEPGSVPERAPASASDTVPKAELPVITGEHVMTVEHGALSPPIAPRRPITPWRVIRFAGRRGLRLFRPFVLPFLHRFEWRVRTAVDKSALAVTAANELRQLRESAAALRDDTNVLREALARGTAELRHRLDQASHDLAVGMEALRREAALAADAHRATLARQNVEAVRLFEHTTARLDSLAQGQATVIQTQAALTQQLGTLTEQNVHLVRQLDHSNLILAALRQDGDQREAAAAAFRQDSLRLLQRGVVPLGPAPDTSPEPAASAHDLRDYLVRTPAGWLVVPGEDERLLMAMVDSGGVLERGTTAVLAALLRPGDTMVDVGAHVGTMTLPAARAVGPDGRVIAIEPGPRAAALLRRSLHINSLAGQVSVHVCAAGATAGEATLHLAPVLGENTLVAAAGSPGPGAETAAGPGGGATVRVALRPLDDIVPPRSAGGGVGVVKIDAEGYELEVWKGMRRILSENPELAVIIEFGPSHLARAGITPTAWLDTLRTPAFPSVPGFTVWEIDEATGALHPLRPEAELAAVFSMNLLLLRRPPSAWPGLHVA